MMWTLTGVTLLQFVSIASQYNYVMVYFVFSYLR